MQSSRGSGPHPLSQPPINATASLMLSPSPPELRGGYSPIEAPIPQRRRFSFPASLASIHETKVEAPSRSVDATSTNVNGDAAPSTDAGTQTPPGGEVWRGLLSQTIDIEGVGRVSVSRFMAEVWKLGGPVIVSEHCLWSNVLMSLSRSQHGGPPSVSLPQPSAQAALALQALYNVAIRPSESAVFAGFLMSVSSNDIDTDEDQERVYGEWTPVKPVGEIELSEWTTLTPGGEWPSLSTTLASGSALTPTRPFSPALGLPPIEFSDSPSRPSSRAEGDGIKGINEILEQMEDGEALREREAALADQLLPPPNPDTSEDSSPSESVATPREPANSLVSSPFVSGSSVLPVPSATPNGLAATAVVPSPDPAVCAPTPLALSQPKPVPVLQGGRRQRGMQLDISAPAFIPPPPMCMFFSPAFRDLQKGKVAVWKGDLTVRGRGGGTFNILIVGEEGSDNAWQSQLWGERLVYPPGTAVTESSTATMIPVSTLAREGLLPVAMGMVLCNDDNICEYVSMVQGLHAEGVAFHLPGSALPIVFLPAKFDSADPLQRLGVAFMTKGGIPPFPLQRPVSAGAIAEPEAGGDADVDAHEDEDADMEADIRPKRRRKSKSSATKPESAAASTAPTPRPKGHVRRKSAPARPRSKTVDAMNARP